MSKLVPARIDSFPNYFVTPQGEVYKEYSDGKRKKVTINKQTNSVKLRDVMDKEYNFSVDKIVAYHFLKNPKKLKYIVHKDGDKTNNKMSNLIYSFLPQLINPHQPTLPAGIFRLSNGEYEISYSRNNKIVRGGNFRTLGDAQTKLEQDVQQISLELPPYWFGNKRPTQLYVEREKSQERNKSEQSQTQQSL